MKTRRSATNVPYDKPYNQNRIEWANSQISKERTKLDSNLSKFVDKFIEKCNVNK